MNTQTKKFHTDNSELANKIRVDQKKAKARTELYKLYRTSVHIVDQKGMMFESTSIIDAHVAMKEWLTQMQKWAAYFNVPCPEVQWYFYTGSNTPADTDSWEDVRYNHNVVGTDREVSFKDFESGFFWNGTAETQGQLEPCNVCGRIDDNHLFDLKHKAQEVKS